MSEGSTWGPPRPGGGRSRRRGPTGLTARQPHNSGPPGSKSGPTGSVVTASGLLSRKGALRFDGCHNGRRGVRLGRAGRVGSDSAALGTVVRPPADLPMALWRSRRDASWAPFGGAERLVHAGHGALTQYALETRKSVRPKCKTDGPGPSV